MKESLLDVLNYLPYLIGGFVVYVFMRIKHNDELNKATEEAYYKGQDDCLKSIPKQEEHLNNLKAEFSKSFNDNWNSHRKEYLIGLIDGSKYVYDNKDLGEYTTATGVDVLKHNTYQPAKLMHWSQSEYYDEIFDEYFWGSSSVEETNGNKD